MPKLYFYYFNRVCPVIRSYPKLLFACCKIFLNVASGDLASPSYNPQPPPSLPAISRNSKQHNSSSQYIAIAVAILLRHPQRRDSVALYRFPFHAWQASRRIESRFRVTRPSTPKQTDAPAFGTVRFDKLTSHDRADQLAIDYFRDSLALA